VLNELVHPSGQVVLLAHRGLFNEVPRQVGQDVHGHDDRQVVGDPAAILQVEVCSEGHDRPRVDVDAVGQVAVLLPVLQGQANRQVHEEVQEAVLADDVPAARRVGEQAEDEAAPRQARVHGDLVAVEREEHAEGEGTHEHQHVGVAQQVVDIGDLARAHPLQGVEGDQHEGEGTAYLAVRERPEKAEDRDQDVGLELVDQRPGRAVPIARAVQDEVRQVLAHAGDIALAQVQPHVVHEVRERRLGGRVQVAGNVMEGVPVGDRREDTDREEQGGPEGGENTQDAAPHVAPDRRTAHARARDQESREKEETRDGDATDGLLLGDLHAQVLAAVETGDRAGVREDDHEGHQPAQKPNRVGPGVECLRDGLGRVGGRSPNRGGQAHRSPFMDRILWTAPRAARYAGLRAFPSPGVRTMMLVLTAPSRFGTVPMRALRKGT